MKREGIEHLRYAVRLFDACRESWVQRFTEVQLIAIAHAMAGSEWDIYPDAWTEKQVVGALRGVVPQFNDDGTPKEEEHVGTQR